MDTMDIPVYLVVKSSSHNVQDVTVQGMNDWTIQKLKQHLSQAYPGNPKVSDQRIIHMGRLMQDHLTLKEMINEANPQQASNIIHLVCASIITASDKLTEKPKAPLQEASTASTNARELTTPLPDVTANSPYSHPNYYHQQVGYASLYNQPHHSTMEWQMHYMMQASLWYQSMAMMQSGAAIQWGQSYPLFNSSTPSLPPPQPPALEETIPAAIVTRRDIVRHVIVRLKLVFLFFMLSTIFFPIEFSLALINAFILALILAYIISNNFPTGDHQEGQENVLPPTGFMRLVSFFLSFFSSLIPANNPHFEIN